ncbi:hypothetical protein OAK75_07175, partial [Bacteriovoracales bacterium]|nr:hypothetical protein [Bacteriovoracales bacterium]
SFREVNIQKDLWTELKVTYQSSNVEKKKVHSGGYGPRTRRSLYVNTKDQDSVLPDRYFNSFNMEAFKEEVSTGDVLYVTVKKDEIGHMSAQLGGLRKGESIYFSLDKMKDAEGRSFLFLKVIFFVILSITLFWLRLTYVIFTRKEKSLSERLTSKD